MSECRTMKTSRGFLSRQGTYILVSLQLVPALATTHMCSSWIPTSKRSVRSNRLLLLSSLHELCLPSVVLSIELWTWHTCSLVVSAPVH